MTENFVIREANLNDIDFIVEIIIQAEKSGTDKLGLATLLGLTEEQVREFLYRVLEEEVDGCEFSINRFLLAEVDCIPVGGVCGWIEGMNEENMPSALLKANVLSCVLSVENLEYICNLSSIIEGIQITREVGTYQIEYVYVVPEYRRRGIIRSLLQAHIEKGLNEKESLEKVQVQVFADNLEAIKAYTKSGFGILKEYKANNKLILNYLPGEVKLLLENKLK